MGPFYYDVDLKWTEGRKGIISEKTLNDIEVATPPEFEKGVPNVWSPEHLYVASANVCLMTTFLAIAEKSNLGFTSFSCGAKGKMEKTGEGVMFTEITLYPKITVKEEKDTARAERIIHKAEKHCLVSNSMKTEVKLEPEITVG